jgi:YegS/Rv2252/BmrU family lipid kinase
MAKNFTQEGNLISAMKKYLFIINPKAGTHKYPSLPALIQERASFYKHSAEIVFTTHAGHAFDLVCALNLNDYAVITAVGGDGTINEIGRALIHQPVGLAVVPIGSGNGLARYYKIPLTLKAAIDNVFTGSTIQMDVLKLNQQYSFNVSGVGFDAAVAHEFQYLKKRGLWGYVKCIAKQLYQFKLVEVRLSLPDGQNQLMITETVFLLSVANSNQFGNNAIIAPTASTVDGKFNLVGIGAFSWWKLPYFLVMMYLKKMDKASGVFSREAAACVVHANHTNQWHIDGEPMLIESPVDIKMIPLALKIIVPKVL